MRLSVIGLRGFPMIEGGVEKHCESLYPKLDRDIEITIYRRRPYVRTNKTYDNISFVDLPSTKIRGFETVCHSFIATVDALIKKPDVVHYHNIGPALFSPIVKLRKIKVVLTYHSPNYEHKKWGVLAKKLLRASEKVALKTADKVIFVNSFQMDKNSTDIVKKSVYIPNGVDELPISNNTGFLDLIGVKKGEYILSVGRITPEKGFDILIKAYNESDHKNVKLVIAGGVEFENDYMKELKTLDTSNSVIFTGYTYGDNLYQLYSQAGLYVLASNNEGFPLVLLEAMRFKLDILASDIPATHLVKLSREDYFERGNSKDLAERITNKLQHIQKRDYDLNMFNWNEIAETTSRLLKEANEKP